jgi:hypothetical protein
MRGTPSSFFVIATLAGPTWLSGSSVSGATIPSAQPIRVRVQVYPSDRWHEGDFVALTRDQLIVSWSTIRAPDTFAIRELTAVEVSNKTKTSGWRTLAGFGVGAAVGTGVGFAIGSLADDPHQESYGLPQVFGIAIGAVFGGFFGLIVGQNPVRVWEPLDPSALDDLSGTIRFHVPHSAEALGTAGGGELAVDGPFATWEPVSNVRGFAQGLDTETLVARSLRTGVPLQVPRWKRENLADSDRAITGLENFVLHAHHDPR